MAVANTPNRKSLMKPLITAAALLGTVQGFGWTLLCLGAILIYGNHLDVNTNPKPGREIGVLIYQLYLDPESMNADDLIVLPKNFNIFMYIYVVLSAALLIDSLVILWGIIRNKKKLINKYAVGLWTVLVSLLSLLDLILISLIGHDYRQLNKIYSDISISSENDTVYLTLILTSVGIVMTLAARGYILWIINVIFAVILGKHCSNQHKKSPRTDPSIIDAYATSTRPPWDLPNSLYDESTNSNFEYHNRGFKDDNNEPIYTTSTHSFSKIPSINDHPITRNVDGDERLNPVHRNREHIPKQMGTNPLGHFGDSRDNLNSNMRKSRNQNPLDNGRFIFGGGVPPARTRSQPERVNPPDQWRAAPQKTAKIGRQGGQRSPPLNVATPYIPDPDYTPPGSPKVKSVLRPRSNYVL